MKYHSLITGLETEKPSKFFELKWAENRKHERAEEQEILIFEVTNEQNISINEGDRQWPLC